MFSNLKKKIAKGALVVLALQFSLMGLGTAATGTYAAPVPATPPVGGSLTLVTKLHPSGITVAAPTLGTNVYTITPALSMTGVDVFQSLSVVVTDAGSDLLTTNVPVFIDGASASNGEMVYAGAQVWNYVNSVEVPFASGVHNLIATFSDAAGATTPLTLRFTTDNTAPALTSVTADLGGTLQTKLANESLNAVLGESVGTISALLSEDVTLVTGTTGTITITGPLGPNGATVTDAPYGTFVIDTIGTIPSNELLITPTGTNATLAKVGTFTFTVAAGVLQDAAFNPNVVTTFNLVVTDNQLTAIGAIVGTPQVGQILTAGPLTPALATANYQWQSSLDGLDFSNIAGATTNNYAVALADMGKFLRVEAVGITPYAGTVFSAATTVVTGSPIVPDPVTGITALVDGAGHVTLSWVNPPAGTYTTILLERVGSFTVYLDQNATTFTDLTTVPGGTYLYDFIVTNKEGNQRHLNQPVLVTVSAAVVASAVSDNSNLGMDTSNVNTNTDTGTVKAQTAETEEPKNDNKDGFPVWGIVLLLILAAVGGYLIWSQKPAPVVVPPKKPKKSTSNKKK